MTVYLSRLFGGLRFPCAVFLRGGLGAASRRGALLLLALLLSPFALLPRGAAAASTAPGKNLSLRTVTKEGPFDTWLRAETVSYITPTQFDVTGLNFTKFKGNAANEVDSVLVSPAATVLTDQKILRGDSTVRVVREDHGLEISGEQWSCDYATQTFLIEKNTRVVIYAKLPDILK